jgi:hypothetical protein
MQMTDAILERLADDDDPALWRLAVDTILSDLVPEDGALVEIGRCSHWMRPHQSRWAADGGFALPIGYGGGRGRALPQLDWSVTLRWTGESWEAVPACSLRCAIRVSIPSRTRRHGQAAVHTLWMAGKEKARRFYGFRNRGVGWQWTAVS